MRFGEWTADVTPFLPLLVAGGSNGTTLPCQGTSITPVLPLATPLQPVPSILSPLYRV